MKKEFSGAAKSHMQRVKRFHDIDAPEYFAARYQLDTCEGLMYVTRKEIVLNMIDKSPGKILDVGCGPGIITKELLEKGFEVYSSDLSKEMIVQARRQALQSPTNACAHFTVSDAGNLPFTNGSMDTVICVGLMCYVKNHHSVLSEIHRVLKPSGTTIIQVNNIQWPRLYKMIVPLYHYLKSIITGKSYDKLDFEFNFSSRRTFLENLKASNFRIIDLEYYDFRIPFIDILFPALSIKVGQVLYGNRHSRLAKYLAHGLLIRSAVQYTWK